MFSFLPLIKLPSISASVCLSDKQESIFSREVKICDRSADLVNGEAVVFHVFFVLCCVVCGGEL